MNAQIVEALCRMPLVFRQRGDVSMLDLFKEIWFSVDDCRWSAAEIESHLRSHPDLIEEWVRHSEDQRCQPAWYLAGPGSPSKWNTGWRVGYVSALDQQPERRFDHEFLACTFFIEKTVEGLLNSAARPARRRRPNRRGRA